MKKLTLLIGIMLTVNLLSAQWIKQHQSSNRMDDVFFINQDQGWTVFGDLGLGLFTTDGGNNWDGNLRLTWTDGPLNCVFFIDSLNGWVCGDNGIWHTNDGGIGVTCTWEKQLDIDGVYNSKLFFIDSLTGWHTATYPGSIHSCKIYKTIDGGATWILKYGNNSELRDFTFSDSLNGWAVGGNLWMGSTITTMLHTNDGGETWEEMTSAPTDGYLSSVAFVDSLNGWTTWNYQYYSYTFSLIYYTNNGGANWVVQGDTLASFFLNDITFPDLNNGWAVGENGNVLHTSDGGNTWEFQESGTIADLNSVYFVDENIGWICGDSGIILHTGGTVGLSEKVKNNSQLKIFPNPANNVATITFELEQKESIALSIRNISGQEVKQISLGVMDKGQVDIDCSGYSQGLYSISLQTDERIITKKLIIQ